MYIAFWSGQRLLVPQYSFQSIIYKAGSYLQAGKQQVISGMMMLLATSPKISTSELVSLSPPSRCRS
jgi:hypothetical protein